jgi:hypothetical protein
MRSMKTGLGLVGVVLMIGCGLATFAGASTPMKKVSDATYAKMLCGTFNGLSSSSAPPSDPSSGATLQAGYVANADAFIGKIKDARTHLANVASKSGGSKVATVFDHYFRDYAADVQQLRDALAAADPANVAFQADLTQFTVGLSTLAVKLGDPFSKVQDTAVLAALRKEPSCKGVVTITGS